MPKELDFFLKEDLSLREKFYKLMNILITNQPQTRFEALFFHIVNYIQILSVFYSEQTKVFNPKKSKSDLFLTTIEKIFRIKNLFRNNPVILERLVYCLIIILIIIIIYFFVICFRITNTSIYSFNKSFLNYSIKIFIYVVYNIILDICFCNFCFGLSGNNPNFDENIKCGGIDRFPIIIISIIFILLSFFIKFILQIYYNEPLFLSFSYSSKMISDYEVFMDLNYLINSILLTQIYALSKEFFLIYNIFASFFLFHYYITHYIYYDTYINLISGIFHFLYVWTSIFSIFFAFINFNEKGIIYLISSIIVCMSYFNIKNKIENDIFYNIPITQFKNINYLLYYLKEFTERIIKYDVKNDNKSFIAGVIQIIIDECPNYRCTELINGDIYLPAENRWRDKTKRNIDDLIYLKYFVVILFNYLLYNHYSYPEIYLNLSMYYLKVMRNYCESMYYCQKVNELRLNSKEKFTLNRLKLTISEILAENLKPSNEQNVNLENLDISMYYKYDTLSHSFIEEISHDIELSLEFWKIFKRSLKEASFKINFNKIFRLTEKIQITKKNIEQMWKDLMNIYTGINEYFEFYNEYIDQINNDDLKKRDLDSIKKKVVNYNEHLNHNYYSILFHKDTGIIIANGDKGSEGIVKQCNKQIEVLFNYNTSELKDYNINKIMPKLYEKKHSKYIEKFFRIGCKKYVDTKEFKTFGKDKNNSILQIKLALKLLPILNYNVFFVSLIMKDNINDIILLDNNYNIQGMSSKLMKILSITNNNIFQEINVPFYLICKKFVNFYSIFLGSSKKESIKKKKTSVRLLFEQEKIESEKNSDEEKEPFSQEDSMRDKMTENLEINENVELEFEIKLPQFLINYSLRNKNKDAGYMDNSLSKISEAKEMNNNTENENNSDIITSNDNDSLNDNETDLLVSDSNTNNINKNLDSFYSRNFGTFATTTITGKETPNQTPSSPTWNTNAINKKQSLKVQFKKIKNISDEEKICLEKIDEYKNLFKEEKFEELEDLIDTCNKDSTFSEYKFNFTFDKYKYGDNDMAYIVRCIDNQEQEGQSEEKSIELDSKAIKYKKEKANSIKPLFEVLEEEREEIINLPEFFLKLSNDDEHFQELLDICKEEINNISKIQGQKKEEILEDENASQTSHVGFDNFLVKKNRIQEIRSSLFNNVDNFYTLKYIKLIVICIFFFTVVFSIIYLIFITNLNYNMETVSSMNSCLYKTTLWTTQLVNIFISLKILFLKKMGKIDYEFLNFESEEIITNDDYYHEMEVLANTLYYDLKDSYGRLEMNIPHYLSEEQLLNLYWDNINVSYINNDYIRNNRILDESFPISAVQFLSNGINFLKKYNLSNLNNFNFNLTQEEYFNYLTYLVIENPYNNIIPNLLIKVQNIPKIFSKYNNRKTTTIYLIIVIYLGIMFILGLLYFVMIRLTNISMTEVLKKMTKIKLDKIEETIKKIKNFNNNLKKFRDKDLVNIDEPNQNELIKGDISPKKSPTIHSKYTDNYSTRHITENNNDETDSFVDNGGFNADMKKYSSLTILREYLFHIVIFSFLIFGFIIPIYLNSTVIIKNINQFLLIENYIYGRLISVSTNLLELKCYISECKNSTTFDVSQLQSNDNIQEIIKGLKNFKKIEDFYNNKFLLNACESAIYKEQQEIRYQICMNNSIIISSNNTDNLIKVTANLIDNLYKKDFMDKDFAETFNNVSYSRQALFNNTNFQRIEDIYYKYIFPVDYIFQDTIMSNLNEYLKFKKCLLIILVFCLTLLMVFYNISYICIFVPKLVYLLNVSRCILRIIPTSVIMNSPEFEAWIENKY